MTAERIKEAQQNACYHETLLRVKDVETGEYENTWWCDHCEQEFELALPISDEQIEDNPKNDSWAETDKPMSGR